jgi:hypothetical protein
MSPSAEQFDIPEDAGRRVALVSAHLNGRASSSSVLVWFTEWSVWASGERMHIFDRFRTSYGEYRTLIDAPAHVLSSGERDELLSLVTIGALFLWDVYVVAEDSSFVLHYSHDERGWLAHGKAV